MDDLIDRMNKAGLHANTHTYHHIILRYVDSQNLEMCLQCFAEMSEYNVSPSLKSAQAVIELATGLGHARLALDLAYAFEASSVRKLEAQDWVRILAASTDCHFVSELHSTTHRVLRRRKFTARKVVSWTHGKRRWLNTMSPRMKANA